MFAPVSREDSEEKGSPLSLDLPGRGLPFYFLEPSGYPHKVDEREAVFLPYLL